MLETIGELIEMARQKVDKNVVILLKYRQSGNPDEYFRVENVPLVAAKRVTKGPTRLHLRMSQNNSPTMGQMLALAKKHRGSLEGYVIPKSSGREDARITFDGVTLTLTPDKARQLARKISPDEFDQVSPTKWRFWWD